MTDMTVKMRFFKLYTNQKPKYVNTTNPIFNTFSIRVFKNAFFTVISVMICHGENQNGRRCSDASKPLSFLLSSLLRAEPPSVEIPI